MIRCKILGARWLDALYFFTGGRELRFDEFRIISGAILELIRVAS